jgi:F0F1-type ATP synthase membrane subunit b/b'
MDSTLQALVALLIKSIPTVVLFAFLNVYLQLTYFGPIARILKERREKTEGVKDLAQKAFDSAGKKTSEFERALQIARGEISQQHEALRRQWVQEQSDAIAKARAAEEARVDAARATIAAEVENAQSEMGTKIESLSNSIVDLLTRRRAA